MFWCIRKPFSRVRLASRKSFIDVLGFSFFFASFAVHTQALAAPAPSCASPAALNVASAYSDGGFAYMIRGSYGTADKVGSYTQSTLRVFENGREIGPAHSWHADIRAVGRGRFSHWSSSAGVEALRISASDNTDIRRNGKGYSYCMGATPITATAAPAPVATAPTNATPAPSCASPTALNAASAFSDGGFAYMIVGSYGTADNSSLPTQSTVRVFENGREIGPAHSWHADIRAIGRGRFSHWSGSNGVGSLRFSASDNTDVRRNGKRYSYCMGATPITATAAPAPVATAPAPAPTLPPLALKAYFVAPGGSDSAAGTQAAPFATLQKAHNVAVAGDTIYMRGGTYTVNTTTTLTRDGTSGNRINVFAYPGETPVFDATPMAAGWNFVIRLESASWWHIKGLEIKNNTKAGGILSMGSSGNNIIENNNVHHNFLTGIWIHTSSGNNQILNNDSHHNSDLTAGNADGIQVGGTGTGNIARGNRVWRNSDDGIDLWNGAPALIENNWAWENGFDDNMKPLGNGNGFKLGGHHSGQISGGHTVKNNLAWKNKARGFDENASSGTKPDTLYNNTGWSNPGHDFSFPSLANTLRNNLSHGSVSVGGPSDDTFNSWNLAVTVSNADFASLDDTFARGPRSADGSLPTTSFLHLVNGSDLIDRGIDVGLPYSGAAPDLGAGGR